MNYGKMRSQLETDNSTLHSAWLQDYITTGYFADSMYRVKIARYSLYTFTVLALGTLCWCAGVLMYSWIAGGVAPNSSQYPEIDFASKCTFGVSGAGDQDAAMSIVLHGLSNATSKNVETQIKQRSVFVGAYSVAHGNEIEERVALVSGIDMVERLHAGRKYI